MGKTTTNIILAFAEIKSLMELMTKDPDITADQKDLVDHIQGIIKRNFEEEP